LALLDSPALEHCLLGQERGLYGERLLNQLVKVRQTNGERVDRILIEGGGNPSEGYLFGLSLQQIAHSLAADLLLVVRYQSLASLEPLLSFADSLKGRRLGVILNDVPPSQRESLSKSLPGALAPYGVQLLGVLPSNAILRSISVGELAQKLGAEVLCGRDYLDLLVEQVNIGAMAVSAALRFFRRMTHKAVVTGGDRADIQMAALQTSTNCLILTGQLPPDPKILARAEEMEVPVLSVSHDTLKTVRLIELAIEQASFQEPVKMACMQQLLHDHVDLDVFYDFYQWEGQLKSSA